jgi:hypothetical protein
MAESHPGWLKIAAAARRYGIPYRRLWVMVGDDVFTRGRFSNAEQPHIWLRVDELNAFKAGGVDAVRELRGLVAPELGEAGA